MEGFVCIILDVCKKGGSIIDRKKAMQHERYANGDVYGVKSFGRQTLESSKILKATLNIAKGFTHEEQGYLKKVIEQLEKGAIPKGTSKKTLKALNNLTRDSANRYLRRLIDLGLIERRGKGRFFFIF